uniref:Uncharacterized protein n=1 Tax=Heterorhabditis bacteriophora TaxID=37862 RepID=A0A1I7X731_HETBA
MYCYSITRLLLVVLLVVLVVADIEEPANEPEFFVSYLKKAGPQGPLRFGKRRGGPSGPLRFGKRSDPLQPYPYYFLL